MKNDYIGELLFVKDIILGFLQSKKNPKYVTDAVTHYSDRFGDTRITEALDRVSEFINNELNK